MWLVNLVQLKKLFLKLSSYVELYLKQDWSLLPVPDFKLVAKSEEVTAHLNFMVAAVLLTATHSGRNRDFEGILDSVIPSDLRGNIQEIQEAFINALEPRSTAPNSPRKTSLAASTFASITPKALFPPPSNLLNETNGDSNISIEVECVSTTITTTNVIDEEIDCVDVTLQSILEENREEFEAKELNELAIVVSSSRFHLEHNNELCPSNEDFLDLQNEIKILEIKLSQSQQEKDRLRRNEERHEIEMNEIKSLLRNIQTESSQMMERWEYEKIERNSLMVAFDQERYNLFEKIDALQQEKNELSIKIQELPVSTPISDDLNENLLSELDECKRDNTKLVKSLKKARDHIINQDELIKELQTTLQLTESREAELITLKEELKTVKELHERERNEMNRVLTDLGGKIQKFHINSK